MPNLRDLLKKKEKIAADESNTNIAQEKENAQTQQQPASLAVPEFRIVRTTTEIEEEVEAPDGPENDVPPATTTSPQKKERRHTLGFRRSSHSPQAKEVPQDGQQSLAIRPKGERRLSARLGLHRTPSSESPATSQHLPQDLGEAPDAVAARQQQSPLKGGTDKGRPRPPSSSDAYDDEVNEAREAQWEKRATLLAQKNPLLPASASVSPSDDQTRSRSKTRSPSVSSQRGDDDIQEAIRLHEIGELTLSTSMFGRLGDPKGANNALAQVLYGLALRHGWGVDVDSSKAIQYLSLAASNSAGIERAALEAGATKGGAAKGELVLAIFELGNCMRYGWGVKRDPAAARQYYETAANLGDVDGMEMAAWCFVEGFGGGKDKVSQRRLLGVPFALRGHSVAVVLLGRVLHGIPTRERRPSRPLHAPMFGHPRIPGAVSCPHAKVPPAPHPSLANHGTASSKRHSTSVSRKKRATRRSGILGESSLLPSLNPFQSLVMSTRRAAWEPRRF